MTALLLMASCCIGGTSNIAKSLTPADDIFVVRKSEANMFSGTPNLRTEDVFGDLILIRGSQDHLYRRATTEANNSLRVFRHESGSVFVTDGRIRFRLTTDAPEGSAKAMLEGHGVDNFRIVHERRRVFQFTAPPRRVIEVAARLGEQRGVAWVQIDWLYKRAPRLVPNDPLVTQQWHLDVIGAYGAWDIEQGGADVIIAILDSGTDVSHPDLAPRIVFPRDALDEDDDPTPMFYDGHGTAVAGLAAAAGDDAVGVAGVCPQCSIMPIRVFAESGWGRIGADADSFYWAADHGAHVISNSWGPAEPIPVPPGFADAIEYAAEESRGGLGSVILFAAGNDAEENPLYELSSYPLVMGVGATNFWDVRESYSNWGEGLDLVAPAGSVTTDIVGNGGYAAGDYTFEFAGTSAACPIAAGVAGLVFSVNTTFTRGQVQTILRESADHVGDVVYTGGFHPSYGFGRVNALRAVQLASGSPVCQPMVEDCSDGSDNDCDGLVDGDDPACIGDETLLGIPCSQAFHCGSAGFCLYESLGFEAGYCTTACGESCPTDSVCAENLAPVSYAESVCLATCAGSSECRTGYDCMLVAGESACIPSCTVNGCPTGEICNTITGDCFHDGPSGVGEGCSNSLECADDGLCLDESSSELPGGYCIVECSNGSDCPDNSTCEELDHIAVCLRSCQRNQDCREGYACWSASDAGGTCWAACADSADCGGEICNDYGLCGSDQPPVVDTSGSDDVDGEHDTDACLCDATVACDRDCDCDADCAPGGCAGVPGSERVFVVLLVLVAIRRYFLGLNKYGEGQ